MMALRALRTAGMVARTVEMTPTYGGACAGVDELLYAAAGGEQLFVQQVFQGKLVNC